MPEIACTTAFNSDGFRAFRGAFREAAKLALAKDNLNLPEEQRKEALGRLILWCNPVSDCAYRQYIIDGVNAARNQVEKFGSHNDLMFINDHELLNKLFAEAHPEIDPTTNPKLKENNPMKHEMFFTSRISSALYDPFVLENLPMTELRDALSDGQMLSKMWVVEKLADSIAFEHVTPTVEGSKLRVAIVGGWIGTLALLINCHELPVIITSIDLDSRANRVASTLNYDFDFHTITGDMFKIDYSSYDIIINTSSEHIEDVKKWRAGLPSGRLLIVQNNNYLEGDGHVSTMTSADQLRDTLELTEVLYEGTREFKMYDRFMVIGKT